MAEVVGFDAVDPMGPVSRRFQLDDRQEVGSVHFVFLEGPLLAKMRSYNRIYTGDSKFQKHSNFDEILSNKFFDIPLFVIFQL